jgi:hypothetical protein
MWMKFLLWLADGEATLRGGVGTECRKLAKSALSDNRREELARPAHLHDGSSQAEHRSKPPPATIFPTSYSAVSRTMTEPTNMTRIEAVNKQIESRLYNPIWDINYGKYH